MVSTNGVHKTRHRETPENVRKMLSLSMPSKKVTTKSGKVVTLVRTHPAWRHVRGWEDKKVIYAALDEDNEQGRA